MRYGEMKSYEWKRVKVSSYVQSLELLNARKL